MTTRVVSVVGARPQFIKAATISRLIAKTAGLEEVLVHTGQHFDDAMSAVFFDELAIPSPAYTLDIHGGSHGEMTGRMLIALEEVMKAEAPAAVLVYGDTNTTLAGALAAAKLHIPVAHVEAGLRSFNRRMPEEINRIVADQLSALLFCPTETAVSHLAAEGIRTGVHHVGDVMYDATLFARDVATERSDILKRLGLDDGGYAVCTIHRAENTDDPDRFAEILIFLEQAAKDTPLVFPVHPRTQQAMARDGFTPKRLRLIDPVGYLDMHRLLAGATQVFTDSGGLQKEAYFHRTPCVTLRDETEWVETIAAGWNRLWTEPDYRERGDIDDYGGGQAAKQILDIFRRTFR